MSLTGRTGSRRRTSPSRDSNGIGHWSELVAGVKSRSVEPIVRFERDAEERSVRLHFQVFLETAVARKFAIHRHEIGHLIIIIGDFLNKIY